MCRKHGDAATHILVAAGIWKSGESGVTRRVASNGMRWLVAALNAAMREASGQGVLYSQAVAARLGMNRTDLECLEHILRSPVTAGALAEATGLTTGAITGNIDQLERAGLARRQSDPGDRRKILVRALPAAAERIEPLYEPMEHAAMAALSRYKDGELALLLDFLNGARDAAIVAMAPQNSGPCPPPETMTEICKEGRSALMFAGHLNASSCSICWME